MATDAAVQALGAIVAEARIGRFGGNADDRHLRPQGQGSSGLQGPFPADGCMEDRAINGRSVLAGEPRENSMISPSPLCLPDEVKLPQKKSN